MWYILIGLVVGIGIAFLFFRKSRDPENTLEKVKSNNLILENDKKHLKDELEKQKIDLAVLNGKVGQLEQKNLELNKENTVFKQTDNSRKIEYEKSVGTLNSIQKQIQDDRDKEIKSQHQKEIDRLNNLRETWARHQDMVKETIISICQKHAVEYVEKVPFKGSPDNTIKIFDEFVIFDAKSPGSDDLNNFPVYIKQQTESVKKYIKEENVWRDIFLVIPSSTVDVINQFSFNMAEYNVYIVTPDAIEPIILSLKKLEEYKFFQGLSPEERDDICRVIGKFAHMTKRKIQIDQFFGRQFLDILSKCELELPREVLEKAVEYEKAEKLNPPQEKREKLISSRELEIDSNKIRREAETKAIAFPVSMQQTIKNLPLYADSNSSPKVRKTNKKKQK